MKRAMPWNDQVDVLLSDESSSDKNSEADDGSGKMRSNIVVVHQPTKEKLYEGMGSDLKQLTARAVKPVPVHPKIPRPPTAIRAVGLTRWGRSSCLAVGFWDGRTRAPHPMLSTVLNHFPEGAVIRRAEMHQEYMKQISIPSRCASVIPFTTWQGLAKSIKQIYGQPLHYLTNVLLKQWDQSRIGTNDEHRPLDTIIHPCKAETTIWLIEEVHRVTSYHHLAKLWLCDPMHHSFVDPIFPQL